MGSLIAKNPVARHNYEIIDTLETGIVLSGTEIKSIRLGNASLVDTFCMFQKDELWVKNLHITEYFYGSFANHAPRRDRKLLLNRSELNKISRLTKQSGFTIIPTRLFINQRGIAKLNIAIAKGKREYDKRHSIREKEDKRDMDRMLRF